MVPRTTFQRCLGSKQTPPGSREVERFTSPSFRYRQRSMLMVTVTLIATVMVSGNDNGVVMFSGVAGRKGT